MEKYYFLEFTYNLVNGDLDSICNKIVEKKGICIASGSGLGMRDIGYTIEKLSDIKKIILGARHKDEITISFVKRIGEKEYFLSMEASWFYKLHKS